MTKVVERIWLTITNVRLSGGEVCILVQGDAGDERDGTWLPYEPDAGAPQSDALYKIVREALEKGRKASGRLTCKDKKLVIDEVRVQYQ